MKNTILALTLCAVMLAALAGCGERKERFPDGSTDTMDDNYRQSQSVSDDRNTNADNGAYNGSFGHAGSATDPSLPTGDEATSRTATARAARSGRRYARYSDATWEQMLENGRIHDRDGFLLDGENTTW